MNDILIKGMEMPKKCLGSLTGVGDCPIVGKCKIFQNTDLKTKEKIAWDSRLPDCPLVELPEHGRLIDADKLSGNIFYNFDTELGIEYPVLDWFDIEKAPTVIEASEVKE